MQTLLQDPRFALRVYAKNRSFTFVAVLTLAIGIGSNIAVFTVLNALLFRSAGTHRLRSSVTTPGPGSSAAPADFKFGADPDVWVPLGYFVALGNRDDRHSRTGHAGDES